MKTYFILIILGFCSVLSFGQKLALKKTSPFTAVRWDNEEPMVEFDNEWYCLEKIDVFKKEELLAFCKKQYGSKWQKRFSEDLVEVLQGLGYQPCLKVNLQLIKNDVSKTYIGTFTAENRNNSVLYNKSIVETKTSLRPPENISKADAVNDLLQFKDILKSISSYSQLSNYNYELAIKNLVDSISRQETKVNIDNLTHLIAEILSEIGDRHSSVKNEAFNQKKHKTYNLTLPFGVASLNGRLVGLTKDEKSRNYKHYFGSYPYIKSIDGIALETLIGAYNYRDKQAPNQAKLTRGAHAIERYGALLFENNLSCPDTIQVVFSSGSIEKTQTIGLSRADFGYVSKLSQDNALERQLVFAGDFSGLSKIINHRIGYLKIPEMYSYDDVKGLENFIKNTLTKFSDTKALIIDIRNNPGGSREILQTFAGYVVQSKVSPWIANVTYLRRDNSMIQDENSMTDRYLYPYNSEQLSNKDRKAIDLFNNSFKLQHTIDTSKFQGPFYMVLNNSKEIYRHPVYILVNEESFSAASVFASAFKGLPNVKIVGETTDGSSGNARTLYLKNSNIKVSISTMLSFQRNGRTLDGNGTEPDIVIHADKKQVLNGIDSQLNTLIKIIN
ncbi:S41 family peptidase [Pedobacter duraquae]|uniref:Peptidase S41-like protein n=1 Tax=Pedobacter duraquae TaxID=425511 RepID=A0A4R6IGM6_9SPHI|nr:S41 family peptidase [Pedobacter duraquae]TDO20888.1 peptidase S41-like protein [Pedobacter duraquae]